MVYNSTSLNKKNNHLSPQIIEHKKKPTTYDVGNPGPGLGWALKMFGGVKPVDEIPIDPLDNWIRLQRQ